MGDRACTDSGGSADGAEWEPPCEASRNGDADGKSPSRYWTVKAPSRSCAAAAVLNAVKSLMEAAAPGTGDFPWISAKEPSQASRCRDHGRREEHIGGGGRGERLNFNLDIQKL
ncbi:uncharacterized protein LOC131161462 isoform X2 [Malania oleifera]|uniref:uncharacterized protein LOC131161462 isoform X2 n=1 Tax=Malania oleifera TaxID=397392 RepID=UPI0025AE8156|nr:uncharacterized protein LOC131161462 isoform X2 [Malania oleifera]